MCMRANHRARARVQERHSFRFAPGFGLTRGVGILYGSDWTNASRRDLRTQPGVLTPGTRPITNRPEGAEDGNSDLPFVWSISPYVKHRFYRPFRTSNPLRGCNSDLAQYSHTPVLPPATLRVAMRAGHHSAWPDSRTRTTTRTRTRTRTISKHP
jgi:hypothetical protein